MSWIMGGLGIGYVCLRGFFLFLWAPPRKCHEQPLKARWCVCVLSACIVAPISRSANANISLFFCPCLKAELAGSHVIEKGLGGGGGGRMNHSCCLT